MDYIPSKLKDYHDWQEKLVTTVVNNATLWGIDAALVTELQNMAGTYKPLYLAIKSTETRTQQQVVAHNTYKKTYTKFLRSVVQGSLVNNPRVPIADLVAMGLNPHLYIRTQRSKITDKPTIQPENVGGGEVRFRCTQAGSNSKGRHPESDGIELFYVLESVAAKVNPVDPVPTTPAEPNEDNQFVPSLFSSRANFIYGFGVNSVGKVLRVYGRWANTADRSKSGPCCGIVSLVIS
jgi:hypothetical protein